jgi:hypothetical protein
MSNTAAFDPGTSTDFDPVDRDSRECFAPASAAPSPTGWLKPQKELAALTTVFNKYLRDRGMLPLAEVDTAQAVPVGRDDCRAQGAKVVGVEQRAAATTAAHGKCRSSAEGESPGTVVTDG